VMKNRIFIVFLAIFLTACSSGAQIGSEMAITRVDNCTCYKSAEGQQLKPWDLSWENPESLRKQFSHCVCNAHIDMRLVDDPRRYVVPGATIK
jgi:hypothetical protein